MKGSVFLEFEFFALIVFSIFMPAAIYSFLLRKRTISRYTVGAAGVILIAMAGIDIFLLQRLGAMAKKTASPIDNFVFSSELSIALYLLPAIFAGIGVNMISHILINHLLTAERRFDQGH